MALVVGKIGMEREHCRATIDPVQARAYALATNDDNPVYTSGVLVPPVFGVVPTWPANTAVLNRLVPPDALPMVLHLEHDMYFHRSLIPGMEIEGVADAFSTRVGASGTRITIRVRSHDQSGRLVIEQYGTLFVRGLKGGESEGPDKPGHSLPRDARDHLLDTVSIHVDDDQPFRYSEASGDSNQIHLDDEFARQAGLPGVILHGLCTMAMCGQAVINSAAGSDPTRLRRLAVRFSKPVFPGSDVEVAVYRAEGEDRPRRTAYAFEATSAGERVIRDGRAEIGEVD